MRRWLRTHTWSLQNDRSTSRHVFTNFSNKNLRFSFTKCGHHSFLNLEIVGNSNSCRNISTFHLIDWYFAAETIQGRILFEEIRYVVFCNICFDLLKYLKLRKNMPFLTNKKFVCFFQLRNWKKSYLLRLVLKTCPELDYRYWLLWSNQKNRNC